MSWLIRSKCSVFFVRLCPAPGLGNVLVTQPVGSGGMNFATVSYFPGQTCRYLKMPNVMGVLPGAGSATRPKEWELQKPTDNKQRCLMVTKHL